MREQPLRGSGRPYKLGSKPTAEPGMNDFAADPPWMPAVKIFSVYCQGSNSGRLDEPFEFEVVFDCYRPLQGKNPRSGWPGAAERVAPRRPGD